MNLILIYRKSIINNSVNGECILVKITNNVDFTKSRLYLNTSRQYEVTFDLNNNIIEFHTPLINSVYDFILDLIHDNIIVKTKNIRLCNTYLRHYYIYNKELDIKLAKTNDKSFEEIYGDIYNQYKIIPNISKSSFIIPTTNLWGTLQTPTNYVVGNDIEIKEFLLIDKIYECDYNYMFAIEAITVDNLYLSFIRDYTVDTNKIIFKSHILEKLYNKKVVLKYRPYIRNLEL